MQFIIKNKSTKGEKIMLTEIVTTQLLEGALTEILGILPVCVPVMVSYAAFRKAYSFLKGIIYGA